MPKPATTGQLRTRIGDMKIGDYISCRYQASNGQIGTFSDLGTAEGEEIPIEGASSPNGIFYLVKVAKGLLVADRVVQHSISWDVLNTNKLIQGLPYEIDNVNITIRSLSGGVAYADEYGNMSLTDKGTGKTFPSNSEFDKYIIGFDLTKIQNEKTLFDVFHHDVVKTWTQDTPIISITAATNRVARGGTTELNNFSYLPSSTVNTTVGFRPVLEFVEQV